MDVPAAEVSVHVGSEPPARGSQSEPPAIRRMVLERFERTYAVPGCRHHAGELHHNCPRASGRDYDPEHLAEPPIRSRPSWCAA